MELTKTQRKQLEKRRRLAQAAMDLFLQKDWNAISIDEIAKKAGVAKGTFYLYFKDKIQLTNYVIQTKGAQLIQQALSQADAMAFADVADAVVYIADYIIEYLRQNPDLLKVLNKNLSWGMITESIRENPDAEIDAFVAEYVKQMLRAGYTADQANQLIFMVIELTSTISYTSILQGQPDTIDNVKPLLLEVVRKMLRR